MTRTHCREELLLCSDNISLFTSLSSPPLPPSPSQKAASVGEGVFGEWAAQGKHDMLIKERSYWPGPLVQREQGEELFSTEQQWEGWREKKEEEGNK